MFAISLFRDFALPLYHSLIIIFALSPFRHLAISPYPLHPLSVTKLAISPFRPKLETFSSLFGDIFVEDILEKTKWYEDKSVGDIINGDKFVVNLMRDTSLVGFALESKQDAFACTLRVK